MAMMMGAVNSERVMPREMPAPVVGARVAAYREAMSWSRDALAKRINVTRQTIRNIELRPAYQAPSETRAALALVFRIPEVDLTARGRRMEMVAEEVRQRSGLPVSQLLRNGGMKKVARPGDVFVNVVARYYRGKYEKYGATRAVLSEHADKARSPVVLLVQQAGLVVDGVTFEEDDTILIEQECQWTDGRFHLFQQDFRLQFARCSVADDAISWNDEEGNPVSAAASALQLLGLAYYRQPGGGPI